MAQVRRRNSLLTICYIDINNLKVVNDTFGHKEGDDLIISTAEAVSTNLRDSDVLCRLGGDEFLAIFSDTNNEAAADIMDRVIDSLNEINRNNMRKYKISISFGFSEYSSPWNKGRSDLIEEADMQMYHVKAKFKQ